MLKFKVTIIKILFVTRLVTGFTNSYKIIIIILLNHRCFGAWGHTLNGNEVRGGQGLCAIEYHWVGDYENRYKNWLA